MLCQEKNGSYGIMMLLLFFINSCSPLSPIPEEKVLHTYAAELTRTELLFKYAPAFVAYGFDDEHNRIGQPSVRTKKNHKYILMNTENPVIYYTSRQFRTEKQLYTNYIYRVHFPGIPFNLVPFHLSAGKNTGLMIFITLDAENHPVLVTTVHTCGCYVSITPTTYLDYTSLPGGWKNEPLQIHGETLPATLDYSGLKNPGLQITLRPDVHRIMDLTLMEKEHISLENGFAVIPSKLLPLEDLESIPTAAGFTSFYHETGIMKGYEKNL